MIKDILQQLAPLDEKITALRGDPADENMTDITNHAAELAELSAQEDALLSGCGALTAEDRVFLARHPERPHIDEIVDALMVSGIKFEDPLAALKNLIYKHCFIKEINIRIYFREQLMEDARKAVADALDKCLRGKHTDWNKIKLVIRDAMNDYIWKKTKRRPMILPIIMEV